MDVPGVPPYHEYDPVTARTTVEEARMSTKSVQGIRVFAIESPSALDMLANRTESHTLQGVCKLLGHEFASMVVRSTTEFTTALNLITSIDERHLPKNERGWPLCVHIAAHGNEDELGLGGEDFNWDELGKSLWKFVGAMKGYSGPLIVVISACCAAKQQITKYFKKVARKSRQPPAYVFTTVGYEKGHVYCKDFIVAWSIFYHQISKADLNRQSSIMSILDKINLVGVGPLKYFRWDPEKERYRWYISPKKEHTRKCKASKAVSNGKGCANPPAKPGKKTHVAW
jgi:hypothetical protein